MAIFDIKTPSGKILTIQADDEATAMAGAQKWHAENGAAPVDDKPGGMSRGLQATAEGAGLLAGGAPDLVSLPINAAIAGTNKLAGTEIPSIPSFSDRFGQQYREGVAEGADPEAYSKRMKSEDFWERLIPDSPFRIAGNIAGKLGAKPVDPATLSTPDKFAYNSMKIGTALMGGTGLGALRGAVAGAEPLAAGSAPVNGIGNLVADFVAPVRDMGVKTGRTIAGDAGAMAGTAAAETAVDNHRAELNGMGLPGKLAVAVAPIIGGGVGAVAGSTTAAAAGAGRRAITGAPVEAGLPLDATGQAYSPKVVDKAADRVQGATLNPELAARTLDENVGNLREMGVQHLPTSGLMTDDPGMIGVENSFRVNPENKASARLIQADKRVDTDASGRMASIGAGADPRAPVAMAEAQAAGLRGPAQQAVSDAEAASVAGLNAQQQDAAALAQNDARRRAAANDAIDRAVVEQGLRPAIARKNQLFDAAGRDGTPVSTEAIKDVAAGMREGAEALPPAMRGMTLPEQALAGVSELGETAPLSTFTRMRPLLSSLESQARGAGDYVKADNVRELKQSAGAAVDEAARSGSPLAAAALDHYQQDFAPVWARGPGDEATTFRKDYNRDPTNRTTTPSSETATRFLQSPESAQSLGRIAESTGQAAPVAAASRDRLMADIVMSGGLDQKTGLVNRRYLQGWMDKNGALADAVPGLRDQLEGVIRTASGRDADAVRLAGELKGAQTRLGATEADIQNGILGKMIGRDPNNLIEGLLGSKDPQMSLRDVVGVVKDSPDAMRGLSRAIGQYIEEHATNSNVQKTLDDSRPVSPAKLENMMGRFGDTLAEALPPEEMLKLRATQAQLRPRQNLGVKATVGSDTVEKGQNALLGAVDSALRVKMGGIGYGPISRAGNALANITGIGKADPKVGQLILGAIENDPATLSQLLLRDTRKDPRANWRANALLGAALGLDQPQGN